MLQRACGRRRPRQPRLAARAHAGVHAHSVFTRFAGGDGLPHVKPHDFRRFVGTELARRARRQAPRALGHKRLETTVQHYVLDELQPGLTEGLY